MSGGFLDFSFGQGDEGVGRKTSRWKGEKDRGYRFSFLWWPGSDKAEPNLDEQPRFTGADTIFIQNLGYVVVKGPEYTKLSADAPRKRIATVVGVWPTDKSGALDKTRLSAGECDVQVWIFSGDKYKSLTQINGEFPFGQHDITVLCTDSQYQKLTITPCRENLLRTLMSKSEPKAKEIVARILGDAQHVVSGIKNEVGRDLTIAQIREKLAGGGDSSSAARDVETTVTGEIDNIVDNVLDM